VNISQPKLRSEKFDYNNNKKKKKKKRKKKKKQGTFTVVKRR